MSNTSFRTVAIAGATGSLGYHIAEAFLNDGSYKVKILRKKPENINKNATLLASKGAEIVYVDYSQPSDLVKVLEGTDVVVSAVNPQIEEAIHFNHDFIQSPLLAAAKEVNVKRFIPSEFSFSVRAGVNEIMEGKARFREKLEKSGIEYTCISNGLFMEHLDWLCYDIKNKKATFYVDGNTKITITSISDVAKYTVESLKMQEACNASICVAGATLSLNELLKIFEEVSGSKWEVVEDKEVRHRFRNKIDPVPSVLDDFKAVIQENGTLDRTDNDKFSFSPRSAVDGVKLILQQAS